MIQQVDAKKLIESLKYFVGYYRVLIAANSFILGSPWESDFLCVTPALYWHEYEIKLSRSDFLADLRKRNPHAGNKHEFLAACTTKRSSYYSRHDVPRPKSFWFVAPCSVKAEDVPSHAGLVNWSWNEHRGRIDLKVQRPAPRLQGAKLTVEQLYSLSLKIAWKNRAGVSS